MMCTAVVDSVACEKGRSERAVERTSGAENKAVVEAGSCRLFWAIKCSCRLCGASLQAFHPHRHSTVIDTFDAHHGRPRIHSRMSIA